MKKPRLKKSNEDQGAQANSDQINKTETRDDENDTNFDIMNSRED